MIEKINDGGGSVKNGHHRHQHTSDCHRRSTMMGHEDLKYHDGDDCDHDEHKVLRDHPYLWSAVGVSQTFLTAIMFGWASLIPVLRDESSYGTVDNYTPKELSQIFTAGAVGNYLATLPMGILLDARGPKTTGIVASLLYGLGLLLCGLDTHNYWLFLFGFGLIGSARPGVQLPTLHLANLFEHEDFKKDGKSPGGALYMSAQAAAFDAGTAVFALFNFLHYKYGFSSSIMFRWYLLVPLYTLLTSIFVWPNETLEKPVDIEDDDDEESIAASISSMRSPTGTPTIGSPHYSPSTRKSFNKNLTASERQKMNRRNKLIQQKNKKNQKGGKTKASSSSSPKNPRSTAGRSQVNAPLSVVLTRPAFYSLATWVGIHIFQLNYVVATINDQLTRWYEPQVANDLIEILGAMLPFGFVVLPIVAHMLHTDPTMALQVANVVGFVFQGVMTYCPNVYWLQVLVVFPAVATSRQLVYSTLFHTIGRVFGYANYGVLLGLTNAIASIFQTVQTPMVEYSENHLVKGTNINTVGEVVLYGNYTPSNFVLWIITVPLFWTAMRSDPTRPEIRSKLWKWLCCEKDGCCYNDTDYDDDDDEHECYNSCEYVDPDTSQPVISEGTHLLGNSTVRTNNLTPQDAVTAATSRDSSGGSNTTSRS